MKEHLLDTHSYLCDISSVQNRQYCEQHPVRFVFFLGNEFFIIAHYCCMNHGDHISLKKKIIDAAKENKKVFIGSYTRKSIDLDKKLKDFRIRNASLGKWIEQVHYIYSDNARKNYCISTRISLLDCICNEEKINFSYIKAKEFLIKKEYKFLLYDLDELYYANTPLYNVSELDISRSIDHLVKSMNNIIENNHEPNHHRLHGSPIRTTKHPSPSQ